MRRSGRLMGPILERDNLRLAYWKASRGKRTKADARAFAERLDANLEGLGREVEAGSYRPGPARRFTIHDPKERVITAPCFRDRVLHHAIMNVCEPHFDRWLIDDTFACRVGKGREAAVERAARFARRHAYFLKMDVRRYFDSIPHEGLRARLGRLFKDHRLLEVFDRILSAHESSPGRGVPIGSLTSQHFANSYLGWLDRYAKEGIGLRGYVRYMDDFVAWGDDPRELRVVRDRIGAFLGSELGLEFKPSPYLNRTRHGMDFLGCRVYAGHVTLSRRSRVRLRRGLRALEAEEGAGLLAEAGLQERATAMVAFSRAAGASSWRWRGRVVGSGPVDGRAPRTA